MQNINQAKKMDSTYLSKEELEKLVLGLSDADLQRLNRISETYTGNHEMEANDLVQETFLRILSGGRKTCPRNVPIVNYLAGVIKSIASGERDKQNRAAELSDIDLHQLHAPISGPSDNIQEKQLFKNLEAVFEDDDEILLLILYLEDEVTPSEIRKNEGWSETQYNSIRKRMRRKWNAYTDQEKYS